MSMRNGPDAGPQVFVPRSPVLRRWQDEWERWAEGSEAAAGLARWSTDPVLAAHTGSVAVLLASAGRDLAVPVAAADRVLAGLVRWAVAGDLAAARVVLERVVPALTAAAWRSCRHRRAAFGEVFAELVGAAWIRIRCYPLERRPAKVAANLVHDAVAPVCGYTPALRRRTVPAGLLPHALTQPERDAVPGLRHRPRLTTATRPAADGDASTTAREGGAPRGALAELFTVLVDGRTAGVPAERLRVLAELGLVGLSPAELAARDGVTPRAVRARRDAAVGALRAALLPAGVSS
ncbi:hypothetical protein [Frankia nepalensis]|uniref:Uncharacterized protein n=1 Tax=Frankia nepalensis TaxID=1836974 RepID=A0A937RMQ3_9ACTN|nr:hypothetical protein [Frankia nepalensis]MBL7495292.1 hypothetical protein [Frankia nepalensis]MBL7514455.1 hypothetical protein [Frankia nepalensis]MBL7632932.1 hypothetical protein [Frankia nepalensis]